MARRLVLGIDILLKGKSPGSRKALKGTDDRAWLLYDSAQLIAGQLLTGNEGACVWG